MTPAELRAAAERLREGLFPEQGAWRTSDIETGADALERLAAVIEHLEADLRASRVVIDGVRPTPRVKTHDVLRIARGEEGE